MIKNKYLLESEKEPRFIDEKKYQDRMLLDRCLRSYVQNSNPKRPILIKEQQIVLKEYFDCLMAKRNNKAVSIYNRMLHLYQMSYNINKPYSKITEKDLMGYFAGLTNASQNTIVLKQTFVKQFFTWLGKKDVIKWIKFAKRQKRHLTSERLLSASEIKRMIDACFNERDRAVIILVYEGALRAGEASNIKLKDISEDENGVKIRVSGKTGPRTLLFVDSKPYLKNWLNQHQYKGQREAPLFYAFSNSDYGRALHPQGIYKVVKNSAKIARINKHIFPHLLRHSRLDYLGKQGFTERDLKIFAGWTDDSNMASTYLHYDMEVVEDKLLGLKGKKRNKIVEQNKELNSQTCASCGKENSATDLYCECGELLVKSQREKADDVLNKLFEHKDFKELVKKILTIREEKENGRNR